MIVCVAIGHAILFVDGLLQMDEDFGGAGVAPGKLVAAFQLAKFFFELLQAKFLIARV